MNKIWAMAKEHKIITTLLIMVMVSIGWWKYSFPSVTWNYKMTVIVETPEGIKTGAAVRRIGQFTDIKIGDSYGGGAGITGEAVVVDLGERGKLFMTVGEDFYTLFAAFPFDGANTREGMKYYKNLKNAKKSIIGLNGAAIQLVTFTDINDPKTVKSVDYNDLSATFGAGVKLKDITVETTDEPVTNEIDKVLGWLEKLNGGYLHGGFTSRNAPMGLYAGQFKTGVNKND